MKIINITDLHISGKNPVCRKNDITLLQFIKLDEVIDLSNKLKCPIICNGDVTDGPSLSYSTFNKMVNCFSRSKYGIYTVLGNHDIFWYNIDTLNSTTIGALLNTETIKHIDFFEKDYGIPISYVDWDSELVLKNNSNILVTHKAVLPKNAKLSWGNSTDFINEKDLPKQFKLILNGHWHQRNIHKTNNRLLINPGALTRREANEDSLNTFPSMVLLDLDTLEYEVIPLKCAKKAEDVISSDHLKLSKVNKNIKISVQKVIELINTRNTDSNSFKEILLDAMKINKLDDDIIDAVKEIMKKTFDEKIDYE